MHKVTIAGAVLMALLVTTLVTLAKENAPAPAKTFSIKDLNMTFVRLEAGEFQMGSPVTEANRQDNEFQHKVRLTRPFYMQSTEVTQAQYQAVMGKNPSIFHGQNLPVENVSWDDAVAFCAALSNRQARTFRLPTEAQWEYAARGTRTGTISGDGKLEDLSWYADNSGRDRLDSIKLWDNDPNSYFELLSNNGCGPHSVATRKANDWGLYDMQGNVQQWVADWYSDDYYHDAAARVDPTGPRESTLGSRVLRGASWGSDPRNCRLAHRDWNTPNATSASWGFRVVMEAR